ncbi:hypothetical protein N9Q74_01005 [Ascidiaceihabitans sp.]|nr:hypothetical protein [Ascidiaceihabitans sp.]
MGMRITCAVFGFVAALAGCTEATKAVDEVARRSAKAAVAETLATRFPLVPKAVVTPFTDCIIDNASGIEIGQFAKAAVVGADDTTVALISDILGRPATQQCAGKASLAALAG